MAWRLQSQMKKRRKMVRKKISHVLNVRKLHITQTDSDNQKRPKKKVKIPSDK